MKIKCVEIENYRNLGGMRILLNDDINFIVGENNIGKSNFQKCLSNIFSCKPFAKEDFYDETEPIKITIRLLLSDEEIGLFDDLTDPDNENFIDIVSMQENPDDYIQYSHLQTGEIIKNSLIKRMNVIAYDSLRNPKNEIDFSKTKGAGAFLNYIITKYVEYNPEMKIFKGNELRKIEKNISNTLRNINTFERFHIKPVVDENNVELVSKIISLSDENGVSVQSNGYGVQYSLLIMLSLLEKIMDFCKSKKDEETEFSTLLVLDEPEIHLHPYLQRTLISDIQNLANGNDEKFNNLLSTQFGITSINAQIIITTHSPNILFDDYHKIIRMYKNENRTMAVSCDELSLNESEEKQLYAQFMYIKEAVFSRAAIIVEGESEYASFGIFARKMGVYFDREGIALLKAGGAESIMPIMAMLKKLSIPSVGVIDRDKKIEKNLPDREDLFYTTTMCFDSEVVKVLLKHGRSDVVEKIITDEKANGLTRKLQKKNIQKKAEKFKYKGIVINNDMSISDSIGDEKMYELLCITWFSNEKGILFGRIIAENIDERDIPTQYKKAIKKVKEYARSY